ncbi:MAG: polyprenyl synthetase family protein [Alicyclobacillaceae bacterium]|nr:polyprenyl synthetase family protein [Alicyclobacillaceae bacterium]
MSFVQVYNRYESRLHSVELRLRGEVHSEQATLSRAALHLLEAGGKRIRPLFAVICGSLGQRENTEDVERVACALELIHMATLVHDDVIDDSSLRRGQPTVKAQFGNRAAMYVGDFLFARAIGILSRIERVDIHQEFSTAIAKMCRGEIEQIRDLFNWTQTLRTYFRRIERKTALLISVSCSLGASAAGASAQNVSALRRFGYWTGMAFQIIDDVLDFSGDQSHVGKPVAGDLRQGNLTLPTLLASLDVPVGEQLRRLVQKDMTSEQATLAIQIVRDSGCIESARGIAKKCMAKAVQHLQCIDIPEVRVELQTVADFVYERLF